jgi:hypothetical protein
MLVLPWDKSVSSSAVPNRLLRQVLSPAFTSRGIIPAAVLSDKCPTLAALALPLSFLFNVCHLPLPPQALVSSAEREVGASFPLSIFKFSPSFTLCCFYNHLLPNLSKCFTPTWLVPIKDYLHFTENFFWKFVRPYHNCGTVGRRGDGDEGDGKKMMGGNIDIHCVYMWRRHKKTHWKLLKSREEGDRKREGNVLQYTQAWNATVNLLCVKPLCAVNRHR